MFTVAGPCGVQAIQGKPCFKKYGVSLLYEDVVEAPCCGCMGGVPLYYDVVSPWPDFNAVKLRREGERLREVPKRSWGSLYNTTSVAVPAPTVGCSIESIFYYNFDSLFAPLPLYRL